MIQSWFCVARGRDEAWEAFCLDLDLAVQGRSFDEVRELLGQVIVSYLDSAGKEGEPARSQLLNRRAPFVIRLTWGWRFLLSALFGRGSHDDIHPETLASMIRQSGLPKSLFRK